MTKSQFIFKLLDEGLSRESILDQLDIQYPVGRDKNKNTLGSIAHKWSVQRNDGKSIARASSKPTKTQFIYELLDKGYTKDEVLTKLDKQYGGDNKNTLGSVYSKWSREKGATPRSSVEPTDMSDYKYVKLKPSDKKWNTAMSGHVEFNGTSYDTYHYVRK